jgi:hypothetical protein
MALPSTDTDDLARFGYKQELNRSLGLFSSFAAVLAEHGPGAAAAGHGAAAAGHDAAGHQA